MHFVRIPLPLVNPMPNRAAPAVFLNRGYRFAGALVTRHEYSSKAPKIDIGSTGPGGALGDCLCVYTHHHLRLQLVSVTGRVQYPNWARGGTSKKKSQNEPK